MVPYLLVVDVQNTILSGFFTFYDRVLYPTYAAAPRLTGLSAIHDQAAAGAIMWVPGSIAYLVPAAVITVKVLGAGRLARPTRAKEVLTHKKTRMLRAGSGVFDLLRVPVLGGGASRAMVQAGVAGRHGIASRPGGGGWIPWAAGGWDESRRGLAMDALAWIHGVGLAGGGEFFLHGMSVHFRAGPRAPDISCHTPLAQGAPVQVGSGGTLGGIFLGV